jgi:hypothetical protein
MRTSPIEDIAGEGSAVILAHAGSLALAGRADALRVLVTASPQARAQRLASALGIDQKQAARAIKQSDAGRADYIRRFYGIGAELPTHYDLVVNTDRLSPERAARLVVAASGHAEVRSRSRAAMPASIERTRSRLATGIRQVSTSAASADYPAWCARATLARRVSGPAGGPAGGPEGGP